MAVPLQRHSQPTDLPFRPDVKLPHEATNNTHSQDATDTLFWLIGSPKLSPVTTQPAMATLPSATAGDHIRELEGFHCSLEWLFSVFALVFFLFVQVTTSLYQMWREIFMSANNAILSNVLKTTQQQQGTKNKEATTNSHVDSNIFGRFVRWILKNEWLDEIWFGNKHTHDIVAVWWAKWVPPGRTNGRTSAKPVK